MNIVIIKGNLTADPTNRKTGTGKVVTNFSVATNINKDTVYYIPCVAWDKQAENIIKFFKKGSQILVTGKLAHKKDKEDKNQYYVNVDSFEFCDSKKASDEPELPFDIN